VVEVPFPGAIQLRVRLTLYAGHLGITAWTANEPLREELAARQQDLVARLSACGFQIEKITLAPVDESDEAAFVPPSIIDTAV
jgi:hypothetical protein